MKEIREQIFFLFINHNCSRFNLYLKFSLKENPSAAPICSPTVQRFLRLIDVDILVRHKLSLSSYTFALVGVSPDQERFIIVSIDYFCLLFIVTASYLLPRIQ